MTTTQAHQYGTLDAQDGEMCIPENYTCNHFNIVAYAEGYIWIDPDNWTARTILAAMPVAVRADVALDELLDDDDFRVPGELYYRSTRL